VPPGKLTVHWRKSSRSGTNGACVEVRLASGAVEVRDTKLGVNSPVLPFATERWAALLTEVKDGRLDH
jgi:hypothetical protein